MGTRKKGVATHKVEQTPQSNLLEGGCDTHLPGSPHGGERGSRFLEVVPSAIPGLSKTASQIDQSYPAGEVSACAITISLSSNGAGFERWPGERDEIVAEHPAAMTLSEAAADEHYPEPQEKTVRALSAVEGFRQEGKVCSIDGVIVPAGPSQLVSLVFARWRTLFNPYAKLPKLYCGDFVYDRVMTTDFIQRDLWGFGTYEFIGYLEEILAKSPELFVAMWLRRWNDIECMSSPAGSHGKRSFKELFETAPLLALKTDAREAFLTPWAIMSEIERIIEIARQMKARKSVTAAAIRKRVAGYRTIDEVMADQSDVGRHVQGLLLSSRFIHHTMNGPDQSFVDTDLLARLKRSVECSDALQTSFRRVECPGGASPALFMNGLDLAHFIPASLYQLWLGLTDYVVIEACSEVILSNRVERIRRGMWLSIVILANICPPTAQTLTAKLNRRPPTWRPEGERIDYTKVIRDEAGWLAIYPTAMALGASAFDTDRPDGEELEVFVRNTFEPHTGRIDEIVTGLAGAFKNLNSKIVRCAVDSASRVGEPGWTRGAYHQAWLEPDADLTFLSDCSKFILFEPSLNDRAQRRDRAIALLPKMASGSRHKKRWHLPLAHPVENVQQIFRRQFDPLQIPDVIHSTEVRQRANRKFAILKQAARKFPACSPINSDPALAERVGSLSDNTKRRARGSWTLPQSEINFIKEWAWQRDWSSCGRI